MSGSLRKCRTVAPGPPDQAYPAVKLAPRTQPESARVRGSAPAARLDQLGVCSLDQILQLVVWPKLREPESQPSLARPARQVRSDHGAPFNRARAIHARHREQELVSA